MTHVNALESPFSQAAQPVTRGDIVYFDGRYIAKNEVRVSPDDRGFLLGDGIYEVAAAYDGRFVALDRHMSRLRRSLEEATRDLADVSERQSRYLILARGSEVPRRLFP